MLIYDIYKNYSDIDQSQQPKYISTCHAQNKKEILETRHPRNKIRIETNEGELIIMSDKYDLFLKYYRQLIHAKTH